MKEQYGVYSVQPIIVDDIEEELRQGKMIIKTAEEQNIDYVVYSTAGGVNRDRTGPHFRALADIENELKDSSLNYTIIKPSFFMDNFLRITKVENGEIMIPEFINQDVKFAMISSIDIARIASNVFGNPEKYNHQAIEIASDELTLKEVVKTFAMVTGKPTEIKGSFSSGTAERGWLEEKGYIIDFNQMDEINPGRLTLEQWISEVNFKFLENEGKTMIQSMWFNLHVEDLERSEQFYRDLGFKINKNPDMLDKMVGIKIGQTIVILIENNHFEKVTHESVSKQPNEVIISLGVKRMMK